MVYGTLGGAGLTIASDDLKGLLQPKWFCDLHNPVSQRWLERIKGWEVAMD